MLASSLFGSQPRTFELDVIVGLGHAVAAQNLPELERKGHDLGTPQSASRRTALASSKALAVGVSFS